MTDQTIRVRSYIFDNQFIRARTNTTLWFLAATKLLQALVSSGRLLPLLIVSHPCVRAEKNEVRASAAAAAVTAAAGGRFPAAVGYDG